MRAESNIENYLNKVFLKDIMELLRELPDESVDMVYGDPDYNVGVNYGDKSYTKTFDEYIQWYIELARESIESNKAYHKLEELISVTQGNEIKLMNVS